MKTLLSKIKTYLWLHFKAHPSQKLVYNLRERLAELKVSHRNLTSKIIITDKTDINNKEQVIEFLLAARELTSKIIKQIETFLESLISDETTTLEQWKKIIETKTQQLYETDKVNESDIRPDSA